jgi:hypothetical protein
MPGCIQEKVKSQKDDFTGLINEKPGILSAYTPCL